MFRLLITGSRTWTDAEAIAKEFERYLRRRES